MADLDTTTTNLELDAPADLVMAALEDADLLTAWLGEWTDHDDSTATVRTDDGIVRTVTDRGWFGDELRWRWHHYSDESTASEVTIRLVPLDGGVTRLTVRETRATACALPTWTGCLLALGAVLAAGSLVGA